MIDKQLVLKTLHQELTKTYIQLDVNSRAQFVFQAPYNAKNNDTCLRTEYTYAGPISTTIIGLKETESVWLSAYDTAAGFTT
jgi:hypothetical protein